ncbi:glutaminase [Pseudomarimonas salicorniae]|uniref:Glutaminase n=1 Tax=Pseudomarimonas salicorniae TaxID=2933270 RepID=A0ABT0GKG8_9GAMM|nr:glutaminase [Lysobacter sp. CAU 1642]MCK7595023.1 glutaminase [Lysobacter sp. CAU 1642]
MDYSALLEEIVDELAGQRGCGRVADYIPPLASVDPNQFGIALMEADGREHVAGDAEVRFSIQSISKVFSLTLAMQHARDDLWQRVGREPSGNRFNSLVQLEHEHGIPRNPFINAGALVVTDVILEVLADAKRTLLDLVRQLSGAADAGFDDAVADAEAASGHTNRAMAWFMKGFGNLRGDPEAVLDAYFHHCAIALSCRELARAGMYLAHRGCTLDGTCMLSPQQTQRINAMMVTCGAYDAVGDFAYRVGLPAKSGVGGGILAVLPGHFSACVWSPGLDSAGNSMLGIRALEALTARTGLSVF